MDVVTVCATCRYLVNDDDRPYCTHVESLKVNPFGLHYTYAWESCKGTLWEKRDATKNKA